MPMPKRRRQAKNEETEGREKGLTNFVGPTAGHQGLVGKHFPPNIKAQLVIPKPPTHNKGSASRGTLHLNKNENYWSYEHRKGKH